MKNTLYYLTCLAITTILLASPADALAGKKSSSRGKSLSKYDWEFDYELYAQMPESEKERWFIDTGNTKDGPERRYVGPYTLTEATKAYRAGQIFGIEDDVSRDTRRIKVQELVDLSLQQAEWLPGFNSQHPSKFGLKRLAVVGLLSLAAWLVTDSRRLVFSRCYVSEKNFENFCGEIVAVREYITR